MTKNQLYHKKYGKKWYYKNLEYNRSGGRATYLRLRKEDFPPGFQTLCGSHQLKKALILARSKRKGAKYEGHHKSSSGHRDDGLDF